MKGIAAGSVVLAVLAITACGSGRAPKNINGEWFSQLQNLDASQAFWFSTQLAQGSGSNVSVSGFGFAPTPACFPSTTGQTATFSVTGNSGGYQIGSFAMTISTVFGTQVENVLTLSGARNNDGTISGAWTLTGLTGCSGNGTFTMAPPPPV